MGVARKMVWDALHGMYTEQHRVVFEGAVSM